MPSLSALPPPSLPRSRVVVPTSLSSLSPLIKTNSIVLSLSLLHSNPIPLTIKKLTMVDVDRRISPALTSTGLRRLSARAAATSTSARNGLYSFSAVASSILSDLRSNKRVPIDPGLSDAELARIESRLNLTFPPDLRAVLSLGLPSAPGFPDWRRTAVSIDLPLVSLALHVARNPSFWPRSSWGPRPADPDRALSAARSNLRRAPPLIPLFRHCYLPSRPSLAGNPVFFINEAHVFVCATDIAHFFSLGLAEPSPIAAGMTPRWIEVWTDAAAATSASDRRRRKSSSSSERSSSSSASSLALSDPCPPDPERFVEIRPPRVPDWVGDYLDRIGSVLKTGGWGEEEVREMVHASASCSPDDAGEAAMDGRAVLDVLTVKADRCSDWLERAGWSSEELTGLGLDSGFRRKSERTVVDFPPEIRYKVEKLAKEICKC